MAVAVPIVAAAASPQLAWRGPVYIAAGFAGVVAMALLLFQPLLAGGYLPGLSGPRGRRVHRYVGGGLVAALVIHIAGLWITSPPDMIDALLFASPTPFSAWGVVAMWALFAAAALAAVVIVGSAVHALLIEGTMETVSKAVLCGLVLAATAKVLADLRVWALSSR